MDDIQSIKKENLALKKEIEALKANVESGAQRMQAQADYEESQVRFRTVFESSKLANKIISADLVIVQVNPAMVELLGYDRKEEIVGTKIFDYTPVEFQSKWKELQTNLWNKATPSFNLETCLRKKDGSLIWCQVTSILFQDKGNTLGYTIIEDITEKIRLRQQKEEFLSVASHELKTPLTSLNAGFQLLDRYFTNEIKLSEKHSKIFTSTRASLSKVTLLVDDLLNLSKIENGKLKLKKRRFTLSDVINDCCNNYRLQGGHELVLSGDFDVKVYADPQKIEQVIVNLINNGVKYAPNSKVIKLNVESFPDEVKVSVQDFGIGIEKDKIGELFTRFYQVNHPSQFSGLGLGLYISSEIIKQHDGEIGVESEFGKGSTFWFTLPLNDNSNN